MHSESDPRSGEDEGSTPSTPRDGQQKRTAASPLDDTRNVRRNTRLEQERPTTSASNLTANQQQNEGANNADDNSARSAIHNQFFPKFKLLRKLNNKLVTARHHKTFLLNLQANGQVPKGLQVKSAPTGAELDLTLYHEWEEAHITLSNTLRL